MTTVAYDGKTLAADSRITTHNKKHTCTHCDTTDKARLDEAMKLCVMKGKKFRNEPIIAIGRAGSVTATGDLLKIMRAGEDVELAYKHFRMFSTGVSASASLLIVTDKSVFHLSADFSSDMEIVRHERSAKLAIGHGHIGALMAMGSMGKTAAQAIQEVKAYDPTTGGPVNIVDCTATEFKVVPYEPEVPTSPKAAAKKPAAKKASTTKPIVVKVGTRKTVSKSPVKVTVQARKPRPKAVTDNKHAVAA